MIERTYRRGLRAALLSAATSLMIATPAFSQAQPNTGQVETVVVTGTLLDGTLAVGQEEEVARVMQICNACRY